MRLRNLLRNTKFSAFIKGAGSVLDITGTYFIDKPYWIRGDLTPEQQDSLAIRSDWESIGNDMRIVIKKYKIFLDNKAN